MAIDTSLQPLRQPISAKLPSYNAVQLPPSPPPPSPSLRTRVRRFLRIPTHDAVPDKSGYLPVPGSPTSRSSSSPQGLNIPALLVVYFITLVSEASRGLLLPSTWPYLQSMGGTKPILGLIVGVLSLGRMLVTVPMGVISDKYSASVVFHVSALIQIFGHFLYIVVPCVPAAVASRLIVGLGSSTLAVSRAYIARAVPACDRTVHYAYLSALQFVGFAVLPGVGGLLTLLPEFSLFGGLLKLNGFTYPAVVLILACLLTMVVVYLFYDDPVSPDLATSANNSSSVQVTRSASTTTTTSSAAMRSASSVVVNAGATTINNNDPSAVQWMPLVVCTLTNMVFRATVAELETVTSPFLMEQYNVSYAATGMYMTLIGLFGLVVYAFFKPIASNISDRSLLVFGLVINFLSAAPLMITPIAKRLPLSVYVTLLGSLWALAYPVGQTAGLGLYSKVIKGLPPGALLGVFSATGSSARIGFAVIASALWAAFGRFSVFACIVSLTVSAGVLVSYSWDRLKTAA